MTCSSKNEINRLKSKISALEIFSIKKYNQSLLLKKNGESLSYFIVSLSMQSH